MTAVFTAWNTLRFLGSIERMRSLLWAEGRGLSELARARYSYMLTAHFADSGYSKGAPAKWFDGIINRAELDVTRAYFFSRWRVFAGIAIDRPMRTRGKRGKIKRGKR